MERLMSTTSTDVKFPNVTVTLVGEDGNAFAILGAVKTAMRKGGCSKADIDTYMEEAMGGGRISGGVSHLK